jgi:TupA-like ATPgrasp
MTIAQQVLPERVIKIGARYGGWRKTLRSIFIPRTFGEKIQHCKLFNRDPRLPQRQDKILIKELVRERLGSEWVTPSLWQGEFLPPLEQRNWPIPFVIKANNGGGWNIFVRTESDLNWSAIESVVAKWRGPYNVELGEWLYWEIKPALLVEPFIGKNEELPTDYKLWTFAGKVLVIGVITDRGKGMKVTMLDSNWDRLPFSIVGYPSDPGPISKPVSLDRMIRAAEILAEDFPFVRVDFYEIGDVPKFGEMTFYPGSGLESFDPPEWDRKLGQLWP